MNSVSAEGIEATCPACGATSVIGRSDLEQQLTCWGCGTGFVVRRTRKRSRSSHQLRTSSMQRLWVRTPRLPSLAFRRLVLATLSLLLAVLVGVLITRYWSAISGIASSFVDSFGFRG